MKRMNIRAVYLMTALSAAHAHAQLPLYESSELYQNLAFHNQKLLPVLNGQVVEYRQRVLQWLQDRIKPELYREFVNSRMVETLLDSFDAAIRADMTAQYAQRSLQLIQRYEQKIKELMMTIEQLQAQEPLRLSSTPSEITVGSVLPEDVLRIQQQPIPLPTQEQEQEVFTGDEAEWQEQDQEEQEPTVTAQKLKRVPKQDAAVAKAELDNLNKELQEGIAAEKAGTAQPGWRERIMQKWQQAKEWAASWFTASAASEEE